MVEDVFEVSRVVRFVAPTMPATSPSTEPVYVTIGGDKYAPENRHVEIDCADRLDLCHAACCRLRVALSHQDIAEGVAQWDERQPYLNRQGADGFCVHCDHSTHRCDIYPQRPGLCRSFDCRHDSRIWLDFARRIPNPRLAGARTPDEGEHSAVDAA
jgi:Fe-S-cluster containining protein